MSRHAAQAIRTFRLSFAGFDAPTTAGPRARIACPRACYTVRSIRDLSKSQKRNETIENFSIKITKYY